MRYCCSLVVALLVATPIVYGQDEAEAGPPGGLRNGPLILQGHEAPVYLARFSPDAKTIATASQEQRIGLWDAASGKHLAWLQGHTDRVLSLAFGGNGLLVSGGMDNSVRIWDLGTRQEKRVFKDFPSFICSVAWSPDLKKVAAVDVGGRLYLLDPEGVAPMLKVAAHDGPAVSVEFSADSSRILTAGLDKSIVLWDSRTQKDLLQWRSIVASCGARYSPDGRWIVGADRDNSIRIWDAATGVELRRLQGHRDFVMTAALSPDSRIVVSGSVDNTLRLWEVGTGQEIVVLKVFEAGVSSVDFPRDGRRIVAGLSNGKTQIWSLLSSTPAAQDSGTATMKDWGEKLKSESAATAYDGIWRLAERGDAEAVRTALDLVPRLRPDPEKIRGLIDQLDDNDADVRAKAASELRTSATPAALQEARRVAVSAEVRESLATLLKELEFPALRSPEEILASRVIQVLEYIGSPEARRGLQLIETLLPCRNASEAKAALARLSR